MKKSTLGYYKEAVRRALQARESIEAANAAYGRECGLAKNALDAGLYGENGYKEALAKLAGERDAKIAGALAALDAVSAEYAAEMAELGKLDGNRIDEGVMKLLDSGIKLTTAEWQTLADTHKDNYVMTRVLGERYNASKPQGELSLQFVQFGQAPMERREIFEKFTKTLRNECTISTPGIGSDSFASARDYFNFMAKNSLGEMQPFGDEDFGTIDKEFPVELTAKGTGSVGTGSGFNFGFTPIR